MKKNLFIWSFILTIFWSCSPEPIEIKLDPIEPKIVVASQLIPNQFIFVALTRSFGALGLDAVENTSSDKKLRLLVKHALVTISNGSITDTLTNVDYGLYVSFEMPQVENQVYSLYVYDSTSGNEAWASTKLLPRVHFSNCIPKINKVGNDTLVTFDFKFRDRPEKNWYMVNFQRQNGADTASSSLSDIISGKDKKNVYTFLYSDQVYKGDIISDHVELWGMKSSDTLLVSVSNISEEYYQFLDLRNRSENLFSQATNEPINYPSNVKNGLGFFNTHFPDMKFFDLNNYPIE